MVTRFFWQNLKWFHEILKIQSFFPDFEPCPCSRSSSAYQSILISFLLVASVFGAIRHKSNQVHSTQTDFEPCFQHVFSTCFSATSLLLIDEVNNFRKSARYPAFAFPFFHIPHIPDISASYVGIGRNLEPRPALLTS